MYVGTVAFDGFAPFLCTTPVTVSIISTRQILFPCKLALVLALDSIIVFAEFQPKGGCLQRHQTCQRYFKAFVSQS
jgi:hypothetical protein